MIDSTHYYLKHIFEALIFAYKVVKTYRKFCNLYKFITLNFTAQLCKSSKKKKILQFIN